MLDLDDAPRGNMMLSDHAARFNLLIWSLVCEALQPASGCFRWRLGAPHRSLWGNVAEGGLSQAHPKGP